MATSIQKKASYEPGLTPLTSPQLPMAQSVNSEFVTAPKQATAATATSTLPGYNAMVANQSGGGATATPTGAAAPTATQGALPGYDTMLANQGSGQPSGAQTAPSGVMTPAQIKDYYATQGNAAQPISPTDYLKKYSEGLTKAQSTGAAPDTAGTAAQTIRASLPSAEYDTTSTDAYLQDEPIFAKIMDSFADLMSPPKQTESLVSQYQELLKSSGVEGINAQLLNTKKIIDGTEQDIRNEVTAANGFATDSQVMAMSVARNKSLIQNYNNLLATKDSLMEQINTTVNLSAQDRQYAGQKLEQQLSVGFKLLEYRDKFINNAKENYTNVIKVAGYQGLLQSANGDPQTIAGIERTLGLASGGLQQLADYIPPQTEEEKLNLDLKRGQLAGQESSLKTDKLQRANLRSNLATDEIQRKKLLKELNPEPMSEGADSDLSAYGNNYAETGKLPSPSELKQSGLSVGQVTSYAKQLPKPKGALVSTSTGTKPSSLSPVQEEGLIALNEIVNSTLPSLQEKFKKLSSGVTGKLGSMLYTTQDRQDYRTFRADFLAKLLVARSGGAVTEQEYERYAKLVPGEMGNAFLGGISNKGGKTLNSLSTTMKANLDNRLSSQQLSIYGYSKVKVGDTERTVGEVLDIGGTKYRVLPDGTLTDII